MIIGIISDTHENVQSILKSKEVFLIHKVDFVIHLGDIISPGTIQYFSGLKVKFIAGNNDGDIEGLKKKISEIGCDFEGTHIEIESDGKQIVGVHGHHEDILEKLISSGHYDYVLHGHTHQIRNDKVNGVRVINPGAHVYDTKIKTIAVLNTQSGEVKFIDVK